MFGERKNLRNPIISKRKSQKKLKESAEKKVSRRTKNVSRRLVEKKELLKILEGEICRPKKKKKKSNRS